MWSPEKTGCPLKDAAEQVHDWMVLFPTVTASPTAVSTAMSLVIEHPLSFWDALLIATVKEAGVSHLLTEDMQDGRSVLGVSLINPLKK